MAAFLATFFNDPFVLTEKKKKKIWCPRSANTLVQHSLRHNQQLGFYPNPSQRPESSDLFGSHDWMTPQRRLLLGLWRKLPARERDAKVVIYVPDGRRLKTQHLDRTHDVIFLPLVSMKLRGWEGASEKSRGLAWKTAARWFLLRNGNVFLLFLVNNSLKKNFFGQRWVSDREDNILGIFTSGMDNWLCFQPLREVWF